VDARQLFLSKPLCAQRVEAILVGLAAADRSDVTRVLRQHGAKRRQIELRIVGQDDHVRGVVDGEFCHRLVGPRDDELVGLGKTLPGGELCASVDNRDPIPHQLGQPVERDGDMDRSDDHQVGGAPERLGENVAFAPGQLTARRRPFN